MSFSLIVKSEISLDDGVKSAHARLALARILAFEHGIERHERLVGGRPWEDSRGWIRRGHQPRGLLW